MLKYLASTPSKANLWDNWPLLLVLGVLLIVFFVLPIFTQKKNNKKYQDMINKINLGDEVKTIGGVVGKVIEIREKSATEKYMVIETGVGDNKSTMIFDMNALLNVVTPAFVAEDNTKTEETKTDSAEEKKD